MKTFIATSGNQFIMGSYLDCFQWAHEMIQEIPDADIVVKLHHIRADEKYLIVIAEVSQEGVRKIDSGRRVSLNSFKRKYDV